MLDKKSFLSGLLGAFIGAGLFILIAATSGQINNPSKDNQAVFDDIVNLYQVIQTKKFRVDIATPNLQNLGEHEVMIVNTVPTKAIFTRLNSIIYNVKLSSA